MNPPPPLCLGYIRVSTGQQDLSVDAQTTAVKLAAESRNLPEPELFPEPATSGSVWFKERPQGPKLLARSTQARAEGRPVTLIIPKVDRLGRNTVDVSQTAQMFVDLGVRLVFLDIGADTATPIGMAFVQIAAVFAQLELARIQERITTAMAEKRAQGQLCGTVPYGWNAVETGETTSKGVKVRRLEDNPVEQGWILRMFELRRTGWGYHSIAKELNANNVPTKHGRGEIMKLRTHGRDTDTKFTSGKWQAGNVAKILSPDNRTVQDWLRSREAEQKAA